MIACATLTAPVQRAVAATETTATIAPFLSPDRLGAKAALTFTIHFTNSKHGVPLPLRRSVVHFPAGLTLDIPKLRSCSVRSLRAHGASGCPAQSRIGIGHALMETHAGSLTITENITLWAFLGSLQSDNQPAFEVLGQGYTPLDRRTVFTGEVRPDNPPYGEALSMSIPPIPTLPLEPDASLANFSLTIGAGRRTRDSNTVLLPSSCPPGGFPFAAEFTYADGSLGSALTTTPCPR